jgi:hypothetical protein
VSPCRRRSSSAYGLSVTRLIDLPEPLKTHFPMKNGPNAYASEPSNSNLLAIPFYPLTSAYPNGIHPAERLSTHAR